jgi:uncharacterized membrane protein
MHTRRLVLCTLLLLLFTASTLYASAEQPNRGAAQRESETHVSAASDGKVHAILFWLQGCGHCKQVITEVLPPLQAKYGDKLNVQMVEIGGAEASARFDRVLGALGYKTTDVGVPFMLIGDHVLVGSVQIPTELPGLIDQYATAGGVDYPNLPGLENIASLKSTTEAPVKANGYELAWIVMALLLVSLVYAAVVSLRARSKQRIPRGPAWLRWALPVLAVLGLLVAFYLSYVETTQTAAVCGPVGDCNAVQSSSYARLFGVLPVGVMGLAGYVAILVAWAWALLRRDVLAKYAPLTVALMCVFGVAFSIYLTSLELFVIKAVCIWCLASAVIMALLLVLATTTALASTSPQKTPVAKTKQQARSRANRRHR